MSTHSTTNISATTTPTHAAAAAAAAAAVDAAATAAAAVSGSCCACLLLRLVLRLRGRLLQRQQQLVERAQRGGDGAMSFRVFVGSSGAGSQVTLSHVEPHEEY